MLKTQYLGRKRVELEQKAKIISEALENLFGIPTREGAGDVLECLILTILSQNTTDVSRDKGYAVLKDRFPTWEDVLNADVKADRGSDTDCWTRRTEKLDYQKLPHLAQN